MLEQKATNNSVQKLLINFRLWSNKAQDLPFDDNSSSLSMTGSVSSDATTEGWGLEKSDSLVGFLTAFWPYRRDFDGRTPLLLHTHICWIISSFPSHYRSIGICTPYSLRSSGANDGKIIDVIRKRSNSWFGLKKQRRNNVHAKEAKKLHSASV